MSTNKVAKDKVLHICHLLKGTDYINAIGGQELYSREDFRKEGLQLHFMQTNEVSYPQFKNEFVPNLSMIDILMFNSPEQIRKILNDYTLI